MWSRITQVFAWSTMEYAVCTLFPARRETQQDNRSDVQIEKFLANARQRSSSALSHTERERERGNQRAKFSSSKIYIYKKKKKEKNQVPFAAPSGHYFFFILLPLCHPCLETPTTLNAQMTGKPQRASSSSFRIRRLLTCRLFLLLLLFFLFLKV